MAQAVSTALPERSSDAAVGGDLPVAVPVGALAPASAPNAAQLDASMEPVMAAFGSIRDAKLAWRRLSVIALLSAGGLFVVGSAAPALALFAMIGVAAAIGTVGVQLPYALLSHARKRALFRELREELPWLSMRAIERTQVAYQLSATALSVARRLRSEDREQQLLEETVRRTLAGER